MKIPTRPAPSVPQAGTNQRNIFQTATGKPVGQVKPKKKPPPRPPPPKFNNSVLYDKTWDFPSSSNNISRKPDFTTSLIDLSSPLEDFFQQSTLKPTGNNFTCSDDDFFKPKPQIAPKPVTSNYSVGNSSFFGNTTSKNNINYLDLSTDLNSLSISETAQSQKPSANAAPTIIRAQPRAKKEYGAFQVTNVSRQFIDSNNYSPPMPTIPPPSPPKFINQAAFDDRLPHGVALYNYFANHPDDLTLQVNDIVMLIRKVNDEWYYGKVGENEGMFPSNFIEIRVPLPNENDKIVTALYEFNAETYEDLKLVPGQKVKVIRKISEDWLYGESNGFFGQFPANFVDRIPSNL